MKPSISEAQTYCFKTRTQRPGQCGTVGWAPIAGQGTCLGCGFCPLSQCVQEANSQCFSSHCCFSPSLSLLINKRKKWKTKQANKPKTTRTERLSIWARSPSFREVRQSPWGQGMAKAEQTQPGTTEALIQHGTNASLVLWEVCIY